MAKEKKDSKDPTQKEKDDLLEDISKGMGILLIEDGLPSDVGKFISTGSTLLDYAISNQDNGGVPIGKVTEITGLPGTG